MKPLHHRPLALTATMLAVCAIAAGEAAPGPAPAADPGAAALDQYVQQRTAGDAERLKQAESLYHGGMRAKEENRMAEAVRDLTRAVELAPDNGTYRHALRTALAAAGLDQSLRTQPIDSVVDEAQVRDQEMLNEASAKREEGQAAMLAGDFILADRAFQMAMVRLQSLSVQDDRSSAAVRELEALAAEARSRREAKDRADTAERNKVAQERGRELRDAGLQLERDRIDAMLRRAMRARERRDYDETILICEQVLKINRAEERAADLLAKVRRERHVYVRQMTADRWDEEHRLLSESIRSAMLPQLELVRYSTEWPELDARRSAPVQGLGNTNEAWRKDINNRLEQEITLDFQDTDIADVVSFLQQVTNANIVLDPRVLAATPPPITMRVERMKLRFVLDFISRITQLKYTLRNEAIYISNEAGLRGDLSMRLYDVRDLTHAMQSFPGPNLQIPKPGGTGSQLLPPIASDTPPATAEFIEIIQKVVAPASWAAESGTTIEEYNGAMVVNQSADVHAQIDELLRSLRNQRGAQIHVKCKFLEVENGTLEEIGVNWRNYNTGLAPTGPAAPGTQPPNTGTLPAGYFLSGPLPGNDQQIGAAWGQDATLLGAARINNQLLDYNSNVLGNTGGLNLQSQTWQLASQFWASAIVNAVEKERRGNVIYEPDITLFNGQQAHFVNLNQQSYIADYDSTDTGFDPIISVLSYGTVLDVRAIASSDKKYITLTMRPTNSLVMNWRRYGGAGGAAGTIPSNTVGPGIGSGFGDYPLLIPEISYNAVRTTATIPDGGSMVLAGMTNGDSRRSHAGVPFLSHIPFLGRLFSTNGRTENEKRQIIVVQADLVLFDEIEQKL